MQQSSICLYLFFLLEVIVHQHIITLDDVKTFFINRKAGQLLTGQPGTQNDETVSTAGGAFLPVGYPAGCIR